MKFIQQSQMMILQNPFESKSLKMSHYSTTVLGFNARTQTLRGEILCVFFIPKCSDLLLEMNTSVSNIEYRSLCLQMAVCDIGDGDDIFPSFITC